MSLTFLTTGFPPKLSINPHAYSGTATDALKILAPSAGAIQISPIGFFFE